MLNFANVQWGSLECELQLEGLKVVTIIGTIWQRKELYIGIMTLSLTTRFNFHNVGLYFLH